MYAGHGRNVMGSGGMAMYRGGEKNPLKGARLTCTRSIDKGEWLKEKQENEERRTFPVCRAYRQPDAISEGVAIGETLEVG